jgi:hypothetical protein
VQCDDDVGSTDRSVAVCLALALAGCARGGGQPYPREGRITAVDAAPPVDAAPLPPPIPDAFRPALDAGRDAPADAPICEVESCNGVDDDCDGMIDDAAGCPCDVVTIGGRAYLFCGAPQAWSAARTTCTGVGYELVTVGDATEDSGVYAEIAGRSWIDTWIGLTDSATEGSFAWVNGDPLAYAHWDSGEPNDGGGGEDCGVIMTSTGRQTEWDDRPCGGARPYVCEAP